MLNVKDSRINMGTGLTIISIFLNQNFLMILILQIVDKSGCRKIAYNSYLDQMTCEFAANEGTCARTSCECDLKLAQFGFEMDYFNS